VITIHVLKYETPEGNQWEYRTSTITEFERSETAIRETADRQAAETDPALAFVSHETTQPADPDAAVNQPPVEPETEPEIQEPTA
jgi:hypothetical protein